jgi:hypothetical protein
MVPLHLQGEINFPSSGSSSIPPKHILQVFKVGSEEESLVL